MESKCPICFQQYRASTLEQHVNECLDSQEVSNKGDEKNESQDGGGQEGGGQEGGGQEGGDQEGGGGKDMDKGDGAVKEKRDVAVEEKSKSSVDAFQALGLKLDRPKLKRSKSEVKNTNIKERPTLTSILIAVKRMRKSDGRGGGEGEERLPEVLTRRMNEEGVVGVKRAKTTTTIVKSEEQEQDDLGHGDEDQNGSTQSQDKPGTVPRPAEDVAKIKAEASLPLAERMRPHSLDEYYGQEKLVGPNGVLRNFIESDLLPSFILWGVPGVGKTSLVRIIARTTHQKFIEVSGAEGNAKRLKEVFAMAENETKLTGRKTILFLDEMHRFNKAVQDLLLPVIEKGVITVIGATTENPSFNINNALLSRMHTFVMDKLDKEDLIRVINRGLLVVNKTRKLVHGLHLIALDKESIDHIASLSSGDSRVALNILESINAYFSNAQYSVFRHLEEAEQAIEIPKKLGVIKVPCDKLRPLLATRNYQHMYDKQGESHYDSISAFHKSIRGSDADAAIFYLVKMLSGGEDPLFIARRMIVIASEDIGLRDSSCLPFAVAAKEAIEFVGMPEGQIVLAHCATKLARAPKSTKSYRALRAAQALFNENPDTNSIPIPLHLRNAPTKLMKELGYGNTYKYNPNYIHGQVNQSYLPEELSDTKFVDSTHLGTSNDSSIEQELLDNVDSEHRDYQKFKSVVRAELRRKLKSKSKGSCRRQDISCDNNDSNHPRQEASNPGECLPNRPHSYDEFLPKGAQPEYFDGEENDDYSDDPDCTNNFECSYDEFLTSSDQPLYFDSDNDLQDGKYEPEYPVVYNEE